jgi:hypothetical protein
VNPVRTITVKGNTYIRVEDVANLLMDFGATEETDVRNRLRELAQQIHRLGLA